MDVHKLNSPLLESTKYILAGIGNPDGSSFDGKPTASIHQLFWKSSGHVQGSNSGLRTCYFSYYVSKDGR